MGFLGIFGKADKVMYYPGCYTKTFLPDILENYKKILTDLEIDFVLSEDITCCGMPLKEAGHSEDFEENMEKFKKQIKRDKIKKIITNCPECAKILKENLGIETEHITETILFNKYRINTEDKGTVNYHPQINSQQETEKEAIKEIGFQIQNLEKTCCGSPTTFKANNPKISEKMAKRLIAQAKTNKIITTSPKCYGHLKLNTTTTEIIELSQPIKKSIKKMEKKDESEDN